MKEISVEWMKNKNTKTVENQGLAHPIDKNLVIFSTVWHISISILIVTSFLLPWYENMNYFGTYFLILPQNWSWKIQGTILAFVLFLILTGLLSGSGFYHIRASLSKDIIQTRKSFSRALRAFFLSYLFYLVLIMTTSLTAFFIHFEGFGYWSYINLFIFCGFLLLIEGIAYLWAKHEKVL